MTSLKDVQNAPDDRGIAIQKVGVKDVHLPLLIKTQSGTFQSVLASIMLTVDLPQEYKGTHMSRFIEVLHDWSAKPLSSPEMEAILRDICRRLDARRGHLAIMFKYFCEKSAPVSGLNSLLDVDVVFRGDYDAAGHYDFTLGLAVPFTSLCPCSKEIACYGAHNQRGLMRVDIQLRRGHFIWIEDLAALMEAQGSAPVYSLLKREDEKFVTEWAYDHPKFVEDVLRDLVLALRQVPHVVRFKVACESYESIHNHNAYAAHTEEVVPGSEED